MRRLALILVLCGAAKAQPPSAIPTGLQGAAYQAAVNAWFSWLNTNKVAVGAVLHSVTIPVSGTPIVTGTDSVGLPATANFACTINKAQISANASGSITVHIWKVAGAIPSSGNKISASAPVTLSSAQLNQNSALTGWTTAVTAGDVFWATVASVDGSLTAATVQLWCQ